MKCKECRHLIDYYEDGRISCEIHSPVIDLINTGKYEVLL